VGDERGIERDGALLVSAAAVPVFACSRMTGSPVPPVPVTQSFTFGSSTKTPEVSPARAVDEAKNSSEAKR
jgi:hypothetical protein